MLVYYITICYILWSFVIGILLQFDIYLGHLVHFSGFGMLYQEKSGNPGGTLRAVFQNFFRRQLARRCEKSQIKHWRRRQLFL
jgi:hypothetical protein